MLCCLKIHWIIFFYKIYVFILPFFLPWLVPRFVLYGYTQFQFKFYKLKRDVFLLDVVNHNWIFAVFLYVSSERCSFYFSEFPLILILKWKKIKLFNYKKKHSFQIRTYNAIQNFFSRDLNPILSMKVAIRHL